MTRAQLGRLLAANKQLIELALREALSAQAACAGTTCPLRVSYRRLLTDLENTQCPPPSA